MPKVRNLDEIRIQIAKTYFRTRSRAVAARINLKLRHDVFHDVVDALTKFRDFRRSGRRFSDPSATFFRDGALARTKVRKYSELRSLRRIVQLGRILILYAQSVVGKCP